MPTAAWDLRPHASCSPWDWRLLQEAYPKAAIDVWGFDMQSTPASAPWTLPRPLLAPYNDPVFLPFNATERYSASKQGL